MGDNAGLESSVATFIDGVYRNRSGVGLTELLRGMGIARQSLYDTFGSKRQLFIKTIEHYRDTLALADKCKDELSVVRKRHIDRITEMKDNNLLQISLVYLNLLQESQQLLSNMRHQLRAAKKFMEN